jgi:hypothetical protein
LDGCDKKLNDNNLEGPCEIIKWPNQGQLELFGGGGG